MRVWKIGFLMVSLSCAAGIVLAQAEWPGYRGPRHDGTAPGGRLFDGGSPALVEGWKRELGSGYSAIAVGDGRVVTMFADGDGDFLGAFDTDSGDELWRYRISDTYAGHDGSHDGPISTPWIGDDRIYGLGAWGHLFAVDANNGKEIWKTHLIDDHGAHKPWYGFTTSPLIADGVLIVEFGAKEAKEGEEGEQKEKKEEKKGDPMAVAGFDPATGKRLWLAGDDAIEYHSPVVATIGGRAQVLAAGQANLYGLDAATGDVLWSYEHAGDDRAMGGATIVPVPAGEDRIFLMNKIDSSIMLGVTKKGKKYKIAELWSTNTLKQSYAVPVYHDGHLYGMSNRIFACVDAATGEIAWRSREPGDGFPTLVGEHLVMITKPGTLHVVEASPAGYKELAKLDLFDEHSWSEVAYAGGHVYARSMAHLARVDFETGSAAATEPPAWISNTAFGQFLAEVEQARDKDAVIDSFLAGQRSFPVVEDNGSAHFVYRGEVEDIGIVGDMIGFRREDPMIRVAGTDLFYYSTRLEPDAAVTYGFIPDYGDPVADPLNPRPGKGLFGEVSWFAMPGWQAPNFLELAAASRQGRLEEIEWESAAREGQSRKARVYLPAGYDREAQRRYPVLYVHDGQGALDEGSMKNALDHLIGSVADPLIAVFVVADAEDPRRDMGSREPYAKMMVEELVPRIDEQFRTVAEPSARGSVGSGRAANIALHLAFQHPEVFGRVAGQSATMSVGRLGNIDLAADKKPLVIYLDWGAYHMRSPHEAWDLAVEARKLWTHLRDLGYRPAGGEVNEGFGWPCWRSHTDELLAALFPLAR